MKTYFQKFIECSGKKLLTVSVIGIMTLSFATASPIFDPVIGVLDDPVIVDDFSGDLSKWETTGDISLVERNVTPPGEVNNLWLRSVASATATLRTDYYIPAPQQGEVLVIDTQAMGKGEHEGNTIQVYNQSAEAVARVRTWPGVYRVYTGEFANQIEATGGNYGWSTPDSFRFVLDNTTNERIASIYIKRSDDTEYSLMESIDGIQATSEEAWSIDDTDFYIYLRTPGGSTRQEVNHLSYQIIPEPTGMILLAFLGLFMINRRNSSYMR